MSWLLLRGLAREQRHWRTFPARLTEALDGEPVHTLDLPGAGTEHERASPTTIAAIAADVRVRWLALRDASPGPWGLLGMSLGGMVAMAWADAHPDDFARVVLVSSSAGDLSAPWRRFDPRIVPTALAALRSRDPVARERRILGMTAALAPDADEVAREWARHAIDRPMRRANVARQLVAARAFRAPARLVPEVLVLAGRNDRMADPSCARALASRFGAPLAVHPSGGHELALDAPEWLADRIARWSKRERIAAPRGVRHEPYGGTTLPLVITPDGGASASEEALRAHVAERRDELERELVTRGALLFRGFDVGDAAAFERVASTVGPTLGNQYLGTSPRNALTTYTFSASELPPHYPIPQHCEMSFVKHPPRRIFFCCLNPSGGAGGETPLADFRAVLRDLDPAVRARFEARGVRNVRNYAGPEGGGRFDPWKLKRWDEMFNTRDRAVAERLAKENGFDVTWGERGRLRLVNVQPATKPHPVTGEPVWFNHAQVFHASSVPREYARIAARQGALRFAALSRVARGMLAAQARLQDPDDAAMACTYGDGSPIPDEDMEAVREAIWKNMVFFQWRRGDVLVIDNDSVSHGRMPYRGPRSVAVAWS